MLAEELTQDVERQALPPSSPGGEKDLPPIDHPVFIFTEDESRFARLCTLLPGQAQWIKQPAGLRRASGVCLYDAVSLGEGNAAPLPSDWPKQRLPLVVLTASEEAAAPPLAASAERLPEAQLNAFTLRCAVRHAWEKARMTREISGLQQLDHDRREQAQMLRAIVANLPVVTGHIDARGVVTNAIGSLLLGYGLEAKYLQGGNVLKLYPESAVQVRRALAGETVDFSWQGMIAGSERRLHVHLFFDAERGEGCVFFARDVTESKRTERALVESRQQFQLLLERSLDAILLVDDTGLCIEANQAACTALGRERRHLVGCRTGDFGFDRLGPLRPQSLVNNHFQSAAMPHSCAYTRPDGRVRLIEYSTYRASPYFHLCILRDITERLRLEREILEVSDSEQQRFSQDLHDGLGQHLTGVGYMSEALAGKLAARTASEAAAAAQIAELIREANAQARDIARSLFPVELSANHLPDALREIAEQTRQIYGIDCRVEVEGETAQLSDAAAMHLYRIAKEAVSNARRHGGAGAVVIALRCSGQRVTLKIEDDGKGFRRTGEAPDSRGLGLHMMQYRARLLGGQLDIHSAPEGGVVVHCSVQDRLTEPCCNEPGV